MKQDSNVKRVLKDDGVTNSLLVAGHEFENPKTINIPTLEKELGYKDSWAVRVVYNDRFGGVIIKQNPGEGNRLHYHPDADECWVVLEGEYEWQIEEEVSKVKQMVMRESDFVNSMKSEEFAETVVDYVKFFETRTSSSFWIL